MNSELYFAIGVLSAMVYFICFIVVLVLIRGRMADRKTRTVTEAKNETIQDASTLAALREKMDGIQGDMEVAQKQMWEYGIEKEEKGKRWQLACMAVAGKSVAALQSCYLLIDTDNTAKDIYDEMLSSLKTVGVIEIRPKNGDSWSQIDLRIRVRNKKGEAPYRVCNLIYPGYKFVPSLTNTPEADRETILEPAYVDVEGKNE